MRPSLDLTVVPPGLVTDKIELDVRIAVPAEPDGRDRTVLLEHISADDAVTPLGSWALAGRRPQVLRTRVPTRGLIGQGRLTARSEAGDAGDAPDRSASRPVHVVPSATASPGVLTGSWVDIRHHDPVEGRPFDADLGALTPDGWRTLLESMAAVGHDTLVLTMVFQNFTHRGRHTFDVQTYPGAAYYPSTLYGDRVPTATDDPVEVILDHADRLGLHVLPGVGTYAFFDYTTESLRWSLAVLHELWERYGQHRSLYGWYVSHEQCGPLYTEGLGDPDEQREEMIAFFEAFHAAANRLTPGRPVMLATNPFGIRGAEATYRRLLPYVDILAPFGFHRMPAGDLSGDDAAALLTALCHETGSHLWLDLETFAWPLPEGELHPRPIDELVADLERYTDFEKVLHYQFPGLMSPPGLDRPPGGQPSRDLFDAYAAFYSDWKSQHD